MRGFYKNTIGDWREDSAAKSPGWSSRGPAFDSQHPHNVTQPSITPVLGDLIPSPGLHRHGTHTHVVHRHTYTQANDPYTHNTNISVNNVFKRYNRMPSEVLTVLLCQGSTEAPPAHATSPTSLLISTLPPGHLQRILLFGLLVVSEHIQTQTTLQARHEYWPLPLPAILAIVCAHKQLLLLPSKSLLEVIFSVRRTRPRLPILPSYTVFFFVWLSILVFNRTKTPHGWHPLFCSLADSQHQHQTPTQKTHLNE